MTENRHEVIDLARAKECLAAFSEAWDSSDVYIVATPVDQEGSINIGHPYVRTKDTPEELNPKEIKGGKFIHLGGSGKLTVDNKKYSTFLWDGGGQGGGVRIGEDWEEGNAWTELARKSGAELLRGDYGVSVTGGSPTPFWAIVVVGELWETDWRKPAPGGDHFLFPAYVASIETWKRIIQRCEHEVLTDDGNSETSIAVPAAIGVGFTCLFSWLIYRRNKLKCNANSNIGLPDQDTARVAVRRKVKAVIQEVKEHWDDPVWSKVFAKVIIVVLTVLIGILALVASWVFGWFR